MKYSNAEKFYYRINDYESALELFTELGDYKDSKKYVKKCKEIIEGRDIKRYEDVKKLAEEREVFFKQLKENKSDSI